MPSTTERHHDELALFPLGSVLFPDGLLSLRIFEARYLDLMADCLRNRSPFGVVALTQGQEVRRAGESVRFEAVGVLADLVTCDSPGPGLMQVRCRGGRRFRLDRPASQTADGLWTAPATELPGDAIVTPQNEQAGTVAALQRAMDALAGQGHELFWPPPRLDDAGWVANRWCELLPISLAARQKLMELDDPLARLSLVHQYLHQQKVLDD